MQLKGERGEEMGGGCSGVVYILSSLTKIIMILPQVHLRKPCYDFYFL